MKLFSLLRRQPSEMLQPAPQGQPLFSAYCEVRSTQPRLVHEIVKVVERKRKPQADEGDRALQSVILHRGKRREK